MPLDMFLPTPAEMQYRVDAATTYGTPVQDNASGIAARLFPVGALDYMGDGAPDGAVWHHVLCAACEHGGCRCKAPWRGTGRRGVHLHGQVAESVQSNGARVNYDSIMDARLAGRFRCFGV